MIEFYFAQNGERTLHFKGAFAEGARVALLGASGAGKTTFLRLLALLDRADVGEVNVGGHPMHKPWHHHATLLHQHLVMFAHHTVEQTLQYASQFSANTFNPPLNRWMEQLGIADLSQQPCRQLSGGQAQRVALLRALATGRRWLLMDEPFSALDASRIQAACDVIADYCHLTGAGIILATHQDSPHRYLCNSAYRIANLQGYIEPELFTALNTQPGAAVKSTLFAQAVKEEHGFLKVRLGEQAFYVKQPGHWQHGACRITLSASDISLTIGEDHVTSMVNRLGGVIQSIRDEGAQHTQVRLNIEGQILNVRISNWSRHRLKLMVGQPLFAEFKVGTAQWHGQI